MLRMLVLVLLVVIDVRVTAAADQETPLRIATFASMRPRPLVVRCATARYRLCQKSMIR